MIKYIYFLYFTLYSIRLMIFISVFLALCELQGSVGRRKLASGVDSVFDLPRLGLSKQVYAARGAKRESARQ